MSFVVFTVRLDEMIAADLELLAKKTHRSKAGVVRWLIGDRAMEFHSIRREELQTRTVLFQENDSDSRTIRSKMKRNMEERL